MVAKSIVEPQPGPQTAFLSTSAEFAFYGGAAGGGKSHGLLMDPLRYISVPSATAILFRRTMPQIKNPGGLWDSSLNLYLPLGGMPRESISDWKFSKGLTLKFGHLESESSKLDHQGSPYLWIGFDEVTQISEGQFFYLVSRNRSTTGAKPRVRATCNPDPDSWVADFLKWWIDQDTGYPIPDRAGKLRYFVRDGNDLVWGDSREELEGKFGPNRTKSVTFIPSKLEDNKILMEKDPGYQATLNSLPLVERMRLKEGNWKVRPAAGLYFRPEYFPVVDAIKTPIKVVRYWDRAATEKKQGNDPDFTVGVKMAKHEDGTYTILDMVRFQSSPLGVLQKIKATASRDGPNVKIGLEQEPGSSGKADVANLIRELASYVVEPYPTRSDKITRAGALSAQAEQGNVSLLRGPWIEPFLAEAQNFPEGKHDDQVDSACGAFDMLASSSGALGIDVVDEDDEDED